ncbi:FAD:protein FMN transferase [Halomonas denitrificans]|nr:FAD:protein FMN transferase [Halomonas denitrificans]
MPGTRRAGSSGRPGALPRLLTLVGVLLAGCAPIGDHDATYFVFGTEVRVQVRGVSDEHAASAFRLLGPEFQRMHREWHPWEPGALAELNDALLRGGRKVTTPDLAELVRVSVQLEAESMGRFNPAIGELVRLWGFHTSEYPLTEPPPSDEAIADALAWQPGMRSLAVDGRSVRSLKRGVRLDFSGIAKGLAVKRACELLASVEITDALIDAGGDVMVCGATDRPWRVGVRNPAGGVLTTLEVREPVAVFTSGNDYRYGEFDGERYAHILDPFTGRPVDEVIQATVIHADPLRADAGATALVVAGIGAWRMVADSMSLERALVVDAEGRVHATEAITAETRSP